MNPPTPLLPDLEAGLVALDLPPQPLATRLLDYLALLDRWNRTYNLSAIRDPREMVSRHVLDSLSMHRHVRPGRLADLGTGAGLPGIPLALANPELQVTLVESIGKKTRFLREVVRQLQIPNIRVLEARAENVDEAGAYDQITARAMDTLAGILAVGGHLLSPGGRLLAMKGQRPDDEIAALPPGWVLESVTRLQVPGVAGDRHLVSVTRDRPQTA